MMTSLSFCTISLCMAETVKFAVRIFSVNRSTYAKARQYFRFEDLQVLEVSKHWKRTIAWNAGMFSGGVSTVVASDKVNEQIIEQGPRGRRKCAGREFAKNVRDTPPV